MSENPDEKPQKPKEKPPPLPPPAPPDDDGYDPYQERKVEAPVSNVGTLFHVLKGAIGIGILGMPRGFYYTGMILGTIATFATGAICSYGLNLLMKTEYMLCKRKHVPYLAYADAMEYAIDVGPSSLQPLTRISGYMVNFFLILQQIGICCVYIIFVSSSVKMVIDSVNCNGLSIYVLMTLFLILFILIVLIPNLRVFVPLSFAANLLILFALIVILFYIFKDLPSLEERTYIGQPKHWVMFIGICMFAMESVAVVCLAEHSMEKPQCFGGFKGILNISFMFITVIYCIVGLFGYARYGSGVEGAVNLNLPLEEAMAITVQILLALGLIISYGLQAFPAIEIVWMGQLQPFLEHSSRKKQLIYQYIIRIAVVILTYFFAMVFAKHIIGIISIVGVVCISILGISFPGLMHLCHLYSTGYGKFKWILVKDIVMIVVGVILLIAGIFTNMADMFTAIEPIKCSSNSSNIKTNLFY